MTEKFVIKGFEELASYKKADIVKMYARTLYNLRKIVDNLNLWKCPKCGNWSEPNCICRECLYDPSILEDVKMNDTEFKKLETALEKNIIEHDSLQALYVKETGQCYSRCYMPSKLGKPLEDLRQYCTEW